MNAENALLFVSIDNLKDINDRHGHAVGDAMVEHSADVMRIISESRCRWPFGGCGICNCLSWRRRSGGGEKAVWLGKLLMNQLLIQGGLEVPQVVSIAAQSA